MPTPLQTWLVAAFDLLDDARAELDALEYDTFLDIVCARIASDYVALLRLDDGEEAVA